MAYATPDVRDRSRPMTGEERKVILASSAGTIFEWYDFYLYGSLAATVVSRMWWKLASSALRACNVGSGQAARSRDIGTRG